MDRLSTLLPRTLHKHGFADEARASLITHRAKAWIESRLPDLHAYCRVKSCRDCEILIECDHPAVAQELTKRIPELIEHLSANAGPAMTVRVLRSSSLAKGS